MKQHIQRVLALLIIIMFLFNIIYIIKLSQLDYPLEIINGGNIFKATSFLANLLLIYISLI